MSKEITITFPIEGPLKVLADCSLQELGDLARATSRELQDRRDRQQELQKQQAAAEKEDGDTSDQ